MLNGVKNDSTEESLSKRSRFENEVVTSLGSCTKNKRNISQHQIVIRSCIN